MKPYVKTAATSASKWAFGLSACFVLGPIVIGLAGVRMKRGRESLLSWQEAIGFAVTLSHV
jgi:hypothetical protein